MSKWTEFLNPEQKLAVEHSLGPLLILAGAGSGKTTVLVRRTGRLIDEEGVDPKNIVVLTFTNKAAKELKERVSDRISHRAKNLWTGTFHAYGLHILRQHHKEALLPERFGIIDSTDSRGILRDLLKDIHHSEKESFDTEKLLKRINELRGQSIQNLSVSSHNTDGDFYEEMALVLLPQYVKRLEMLGVVDFEGLLLKPLELFDQFPHIKAFYQEQIQFLMVDEFQDTNKLQLKFVRQLVERHNNIAVVGDDDQAIYGWRGAEVENILTFPSLYDACEVIRLERNYRSSGAIIDLANAIISKNQKRHHKVLKAEARSHGLHDEGNSLPELFVHATEEEECEDVIQQIRFFQSKEYSLREIALLYRSNSQGALVEALLRQNQIPYSLTGGSTFFEKKEVKDVMAYLRCAVLPNEISLRRIYTTPSRGIGEVTLKKIEHFSQIKKNSFYESSVLIDEVDVGERQKKSLEKVFIELNSLRDLILKPVKGSGDLDIPQKLQIFFTENGYKDFLFATFKDVATAQKRWAYIEIVGRILQGFYEKKGVSRESLKDFLDSIDLREILEESDQNQQEDRLQMLTLHACKGLEFPVVLLLGIEEDLLPHRTLGADLSEERRLFYVGVTRAKKHLVLSRALQRKKMGKMRPSAPSRFLEEIDQQKLLKTYEEGFRPFTGDQRQNLLDDLYKKLDKQILSNKK